MLFAIRCKDGKYVLVNKKDQTARPVSLEEALRHTRDMVHNPKITRREMGSMFMDLIKVKTTVICEGCGHATPEKMMDKMDIIFSEKLGNVVRRGQAIIVFTDGCPKCEPDPF